MLLSPLPKSTRYQCQVIDGSRSQGHRFLFLRYVDSVGPNIDIRTLLAGVHGGAANTTVGQSSPRRVVNHHSPAIPVPYLESRVSLWCSIKILALDAWSICPMVKRSYQSFLFISMRL